MTKIRPIRSFVIRQRLLSATQEHQFNELWRQWGLNPAQPLPTNFTQDAPCFLEIGYGNGTGLTTLAQQHPEHNFIGIEVFKPGIMALLQQIHTLNLTNIRLYHGDAVTILANCIAPQSLQGIQIFFPDPWPKKRHHKRRLIQPATVTIVTNTLKNRGSLHLATDWQDYAQHMIKILNAAPNLRNIASDTLFAERSALRPVITKFEQHAQTSGRTIWDLQFERI